MCKLTLLRGAGEEVGGKRLLDQCPFVGPLKEVGVEIGMLGYGELVLRH